jgi:CubicO group peptidase (beta-lactamase class C family)
MTVNSLYFHKPRLQALHQFADQQITQQNFAGMAWSVEHKGSVVDEGLLGYSDHALEQALQSDALYRLYSMTKPIVSVRCLQLLEAGRLRLDDPVSRWIPEFATMSVFTQAGKLEPAHRQITIEDLLMHRSGLSYDFLAGCPAAQLYREAGLAEDGTRSLKDLVSLLAGFPLARQPGQRWHYSYATDVLAHVLECVSGQTISDCLLEGLFEPLGMNETGFQVDSCEHHRVADMFGQRQLGQEETDVCTTNDLRAMDVSESYPMSSGGEFARGGIGLFSTLSDYRRFLPVLMHGNSSDGEPLLSAMTLDMLWQNRLTTAQMPIAIGDRAYAGYGWGLTGRIMSDTGSASTVSAAGEGGWAGAASTYFWVDRANAVAGIVMAQYLGSAIAVGPTIQSLAYGALCHKHSTRP